MANYSMESEGVDFILRFRDQASGQIGTAEKAYSKLVSTMQSLISTQRSFSDSVVESITVASAALRNNPMSIVTPLTVSADHIGLMKQFEGASTSWFNTMSSMLDSYVKKVTKAATGTGTLTDSLRKLSEDLALIGKELKDDTNPKLKVSEEETQQFARAVQILQYHLDDLARRLGIVGKTSDETKPKIKGLFDIFDQFSKLKTAVGGALGSVIMGEGVLKYSSIEDAAYAITQKVGGNVTDLTKKILELSMTSEMSAKSLGNALAVIADTTGTIDKDSFDIARKVAEYSVVTNTALENNAKDAATLKAQYAMSKDAVNDILMMSDAMRRHAVNLQGPELMGYLTHNIVDMRNLAQAAGMGGAKTGEFITKFTPGLAGAMAELTRQAHGIEEVQTILQSATSMIGENESSIRGLIQRGGGDFNQYRKLMQGGKPEEALGYVADQYKNWLKQFSDDQKGTMRTLASQMPGMSKDFLAALETYNTQNAKIKAAEVSDKTRRDKEFAESLKQWHETYKGMMTDLEIVWTYFQARIYPHVKGMVDILHWLVQFAIQLHQSKIGPAVDALADSITGLVVAMTALGALRGVLGGLGWIARGLGLAGGAAAEVGGAAAVGEAATGAAAGVAGGGLLALAPEIIALTVALAAVTAAAWSIGKLLSKGIDWIEDWWYHTVSNKETDAKLKSKFNMTDEQIQKLHETPVTANPFRTEKDERSIFRRIAQGDWKTIFEHDKPAVQGTPTPTVHSNKPTVTAPAPTVTPAAAAPVVKPPPLAAPSPVYTPEAKPTAEYQGVPYTKPSPFTPPTPVAKDAGRDHVFTLQEVQRQIDSLNVKPEVNVKVSPIVPESKPVQVTPPVVTPAATGQVKADGFDLTPEEVQRRIADTTKRIQESIKPAKPEVKAGPAATPVQATPPKITPPTTDVRSQTVPLQITPATPGSDGKPKTDLNVTPKPAPPPPTPAASVQPVAYHQQRDLESSDLSDALEQISKTGDNRTVVEELRRISVMIEFALRKMDSSSKGPMVPRHLKIAANEI